VTSSAGASGKYPPEDNEVDDQGVEGDARGMGLEWDRGREMRRQRKMITVREWYIVITSG